MANEGAKGNEKAHIVFTAAAVAMTPGAAMGSSIGRGNLRCR
jgi:hypothetical protein